MILTSSLPHAALKRGFWSKRLVFYKACKRKMLSLSTIKATVYPANDLVEFVRSGDNSVR